MKGYFATVMAVLSASFVLAGCGTAHIVVKPDRAPPTGDCQIRPLTMDLYIAPEIVSCEQVSRTAAFGAGPGYRDIEVTFDIGSALTETIESTVRRHFREVRRIEDRDCAPGSDGVVLMSFAKAPSVAVRWVQRMVSEGGGATIELAVSAVMQDCHGRVVWRGVAQGFGTDDLVESNLLWTSPNERQFRPAIDHALQELARTLDAELTKAKFVAAK